MPAALASKLPLADKQFTQEAIHSPPGTSAVKSMSGALAHKEAGLVKLLLVFGVTVKAPEDETGHRPSIE